MDKIIGSLILGYVLMCAFGCAPIVVGGAVGAAGVYAASRDTMQGDTDKPYEGLWRASKEVAENYGSIRSEDQKRGYIDLETETGDIWIRISRMTRNSNRLRVCARNRYHLPDLAQAQNVYARILEGAD